MWTKPYGMKEGGLIGGGLIIAGLMLELGVGPVGYDTQMGPMSQTSILELVSDPWLPLVYTGIYMMLAGAVCMFLKGKKVKK